MTPEPIEPIEIVLKDPRLAISAAALIFALIFVFGLWVWHMIDAERKRQGRDHDDDQYPPMRFP
jgi:hypothetical protein